MAKNQKPDLLSFDTNAWSYLVRQESMLRRQALLRLRREVHVGRIQVAMSHPLVSELCGLAANDRGTWRKALRELVVLGRGRLLHERAVRWTLEKKLRRPLRRSEMFRVKLSVGRMFHALTSDPNLANAEVARIKGIKEAWGEKENERRDAVRAESDPEKKKRWNQEFRANPKPKILDWCRDNLKAEQIDPESLPTLWHYFSYHLARIYLVGTEGEGRSRIQENDFMDRDHYADACYSNALVTDDRGLHRVAALCPEPKVKLLKLDDWAASILSKR